MEHANQLHRRGGALPVALGILVLISAMIAVSTTRGAAVFHEVTHSRDRETALAAVEAVLARHEIAIITRAEAGDPIEFAKWTDNYGAEIFGPCEVRWKVEPVRSVPRDGLGDQIPFISNPPPDISNPTPTSGILDGAGNALVATDVDGKPYWEPNDSVYLFRLSAEAVVLNGPVADNVDWSTQAGLTKARAQGARYIAINKEPLFRYVIFYAQQGPKGDLELSHGPGINIQGNVHSNGSIYMGTDALPASKWDAARRVPDSAKEYHTQIGPDAYDSSIVYNKGARVYAGAPKKYYEYINNASVAGKAVSETAYWKSLDDGRVKVTGVEGVFRLAKPAMYMRFSNFEMSSDVWSPWSRPSGTVTNSQYDADTNLKTPLDGYDGGGSGIASMTYDGGWVNPYRIKEASGLVTRPGDDGELTADISRRINGVALKGAGDTGNDSRDLERTSATWEKDSTGDAPKGFSGFVRTKETGGRTKQLPDTLASRPLDAQKLFYPDLYVLSKARQNQKVTQGDKNNPLINAMLNGLAVDTVLSPTTPELQALFTANRERGDAHDRATPVFLRTGMAWSAGTAYRLVNPDTGKPDRIVYLNAYYDATEDHVADASNAPDGADKKWNPASASETSNYNDVKDDANILEVPGQYVRYAIDGTGSTQSYMRRNMDTVQGFIGWTFTDAKGAAIPQPTKSGLIIRERPVPDFKYWGQSDAAGTLLFADKTTSSPSFTPFAYGKQKDTTVWPFTELWVSNQGTSFAGEATKPTTWKAASTPTPAVNGSGAGSAWVKTSTSYISTTNSTQEYQADTDNGGRLIVTTAAARGSPQMGSITNVDSRSAADGNGFFSDSWRLIHMKRSTITNETTPRADMHDQDEAYFDKDSFTLVETRLMADESGNLIATNNTGNTRKRLAGLMVRPVATDASSNADLDLKANGLNGRSPFAAILFSPFQGIMVQRRASPSGAVIAVQPGAGYRAYTGINDNSSSDDARLGCLPADPAITANAVVQPSRQPLVDNTYSTTVHTYDTGVVRNPTTGYTASAISNNGSSFSVTLTKAGEASTSASFTLTRGPWKKSQTFTATKTRNIYKLRQRTAVGNDGYIDLKVTGANSVLTNYRTSMVGFTTTTGNANWANGWSGRPFWLNPVWGGGYATNPTAAGLAVAPYTTIPNNGFVADDTLRLPYYRNTPTGTFATFNTTSNPTSTAMGIPAGDYYYQSDPETAYYSTTVEVSSGDPSSVVYRTSAYDDALDYVGGDEDTLLSKLSGISTAKNTPSLADPTAPADGDFTAIPGTPTPATPTLPGTSTQPPDLGTAKVRIAIRRESAASAPPTRAIEMNSWISARGTWASPPGNAASNGFARFQLTANNNKDLVNNASLLDENYNPTMDITHLGYSESLRPDYWTGPVKSASWADPYDPMDAASGSIVPGSNGYTAPSPNYLNTSSGTAEYRLWEDAQIPYWTVGTQYVTSPRPSLVLYANTGKVYVCKTANTAANTTASRPNTSGSTYWAEATHVYMRIRKSGDLLRFEYYVGLDAPASDAEWRIVNPATVRSADNLAADNWATETTDPLIHSTVDVSNWDDRWVVGPAVQSGHNTYTATAIFTNLRLKTTTEVIDSTDWESAVSTFNTVTPSDGSGLVDRTVNNTTKYLCSQYQAFWGPTEITEDFFSWTNGSTGKDADRTATELWFYNPREFWSQSAWWNEGDLGSSWLPISSGDWAYKETGTSTAPSALPSSSKTATHWIEWAGRTTALNLDMQNVQAYITARNLTNASYRWSTNTPDSTSSASLLSTFTGLIYAARTNRYPRNPLPSQLNPWNPGLPNQEDNALLTTATEKDFVHMSLVDLWDKGDDTKVRDRLMPQIVAGNRDNRAPPAAYAIRSSDFHHGVMISNANAINWGYSSPKVFGESKTSIVTPNQLFLKGDLNNTAYTVKETAGGTKTRDSYTPLAVMGDSVTLLSNNWKADTSSSGYCRPGLLVDSTGVTSAGRNQSTLSQLNGAAASTTSYRTCILTNNQPTTRYRAFQDEGAPFVNTMLFMENWSGKTMNFTGSLVVMDSCRYTGSFLLQNARTVGRSPFGTMGWHSNATWKDVTGWTTAAGSVDWCYTGTKTSWLPTGTNTNNASSPYGSPQVYAPPTRNLSFNTDLLSEQGTPPNTPFGVTAAGVAGWSRIIQ